MWITLPSKINSMNRENGFYWVRFQDESWEIAKFENGRWLVIGVDDSNIYHDKDFEKIEEEPIKKYRR